MCNNIQLIIRGKNYPKELYHLGLFANNIDILVIAYIQILIQIKFSKEYFKHILQ